MKTSRASNTFVTSMRGRAWLWASDAFLVALGALAVSGCGEAPQDEHSIELVARAREPGVVILADGTEVTLTRAEVAFGPLYLCPGTTAGEACDAARLEWRDSAVVELLDAADQPLGEVSGVTGGVNSWMFDYGVTSLLGKDEALVSPAAAELGGVSLRLEGTALVNGTAVTFSLAALASQGADVEQGVQVVRSSSSDDFDYEVTLETAEVRVEFDVSPWLLALDGSDFCPENACESAIDIGVDAPSAARVAQAMVAGVRPEFTLR